MRVARHRSIRQARFHVSRFRPQSAPYREGHSGPAPCRVRSAHSPPGWQSVRAAIAWKPSQPAGWSKQTVPPARSLPERPREAETRLRAGWLRPPQQGPGPVRPHAPNASLHRLCRTTMPAIPAPHPGHNPPAGPAAQPWPTPRISSLPENPPPDHRLRRATPPGSAARCPEGSDETEQCGPPDRRLPAGEPSAVPPAR